jgi:hypothetical protein
VDHEPKPSGDRASPELRDRFLEAFAADDYAALRSLCADLRHCADILPSKMCAALGLPRGSTYAKAARTIVAS